MDMVRGAQIGGARLADWRKLGQGLHARYLVADFATAARFLVAIGEAGAVQGHHPRVAVGPGYVDLKLITDDAVFRDDEGTEYHVEWVTQQDLDLAARITALAPQFEAQPDPGAVSVVELGLDAADSATIAPVWSALLTGGSQALGRGTLGDDVRDATGRVPILWFGEASPGAEDRPTFHLEVYVPPETVAERVAAVVAAGGTIVDDSDSPAMVVLADQEGHRAIICADVDAAAIS